MERLRILPEVQSVSSHIGAPVARTNNTSRFQSTTETSDQFFMANRKMVDLHYLETFDIQLLAGRHLRKKEPFSNVVVSMAFLEAMGVKEATSGIGMRVRPSYNLNVEYKIVGVVLDFNSFSLHQGVTPVMLEYNPLGFTEVAVKLSSPTEEHKQKSLAKIERLWDELYPTSLFQYDFLEDQVKAQYQKEQDIHTIFQFFCGLAIVIAALGLYSLMDYMAIKKLREIALRKALGASTSSIITLLTKEIGWMLLISFILSAPSMYYLSQDFLDAYYVRVSLGPGLFLASFGIIILISLFATAFRSIGASTSNPVDHLKNE